MSETVYLQIKRNIEVVKRTVTIGDVSHILCNDNAMAAKIKTLKLIKIDDVKKKRICFSCMYVIELINQEYPDVDVNNIGESDFVVDYIKKKKHYKFLQILLIAFVALFTFIGSMYAVMAYNNDVGTIEIFDRVYSLFGNSGLKDLKLLEITYALGLAGGIILFYNHFGGKRFGTDPSPIEVEMQKYEKDVDDTLIERSDAKNEEKML